MGDRSWRTLSGRQCGVVSLAQLRDLGITRAEVRHHLRMERWSQRTSSVLSTTTGPLSWDQRLWVAALHGGPSALIGGLTAGAVHGLRNWERAEVTVLVDDELSFEPLEGVRFFRSRRPLGAMRAPTELPLCRIEPALLLFAGYERNRRAAHGCLAAAVQQRLTTPSDLSYWIEWLRPLRRSREFRALMADLHGGAQSMAEVDVRNACRKHGLAAPTAQRRRRDRSGRLRFTDCEWQLPGGRTLVLEVDGAFHDDVMQAADDKSRARKLSATDRIVVACSAFELRYHSASVVEDLIALGVPRR